MQKLTCYSYLLERYICMPKEEKVMANITKAQFKKRISELKDKISDLRFELEDLQSDLETESSDIEPYENRYELTELQEQRQEWLDNTASHVESAI